MYLHADHENSLDYVVLDLDAGTVIRYCQWADDATGKYCVANVLNGKAKLNADGTIETYEKQGNIKLIHKAKLMKSIGELEELECEELTA